MLYQRYKDQMYKIDELEKKVDKKNSKLEEFKWNVGQLEK